MISSLPNISINHCRADPLPDFFVVGQCTFTVGEVFFCEQQVGLADVDLVTVS